jgi:hypothetical protein
LKASVGGGAEEHRIASWRRDARTWFRPPDVVLRCSTNSTAL